MYLLWAKGLLVAMAEKHMALRSIIKVCLVACLLFLFLGLLMGGALWHRGFSPTLLPAREWGIGRFPPRLLSSGGGRECRWKLGFFEMAPNCEATPCSMCSPF